MVRGEDADDSAAFTNYTNYINRTRTGNYYARNIDTLDFQQRADNGDTLVFSPLTLIVREIIDRPGWASGNDMTFFLREQYTYPTPSASDYFRFDMWDSNTSAWVLEIEYMSDARYTSSAYFGARSTSRGEDFRAWINAHEHRQPAGISIGVGNWTGIVQRPAFAGSFIPNAECGIVLASYVDETYDDRVKFIITPPLSEQYEGRYRAFVRAAITLDDEAQIDDETAKMRLRTQMGSGSSSFTNDTSILHVNTPSLIDMGIITIPKVGGADRITLAVQTLTSDVNYIYIFGLCLIPIDEWYLEATQPSSSVTVLDSDSYLEIDSASSSPDAVTANIRDKGSTASRASMLIAGSQASLASQRTQRVWVATTSDLRSQYTDPNTVPRALYFTAGSHTDIVHEVSAEAVLRFLGMRGSG